MNPREPEAAREGMPEDNGIDCEPTRIRGPKEKTGTDG
jgi:hypothetical protein